MTFPSHEYLNLTDQEIENLFKTDPVLMDYDLRRQQKIATIAQDEKSMAELDARKQQLEEELARLTAEAMQVKKQIRHTFGEVKGYAYRISMAKKVLRNIDSREKIRQKQVYKNEVTRRLAALGGKLHIRRRVKSAVMRSDESISLSLQDEATLPDETNIN